MYVWDNKEKRFRACTRNWTSDHNPIHDFSGTIILFNTPVNEDISQSIGEATFSKGSLINYTKSIEEYLPEIIIALSEKKSSGFNWKVKGRIFDESLVIGAKAAPVRSH